MNRIGLIVLVICSFCSCSNEDQKFSFFALGSEYGAHQVHSIIEDRKGNLWFGTNTGLYKYDGKKVVQFGDNKPFSRKVINTLAESKNGTLWVGTENGMYRFDGENFSRFTIPPADVNDHASIDKVMEDRSGNLWVSLRGLLMKYDGQSFSFFTGNKGYNSDYVCSMTQDRSGAVWFGTSNGGVSVYDGLKTIEICKSDSSASIVRRETGPCLNHITPSSNNGINEASGVIAICEDNAGNYWFGADGKGVCKYNGKSFEHYSMNDGLGSNSVSAIMQDREGSMWFGTRGGGLCQFNGKQMTRYTEDNGLAGYYIWTVFQDRQGRIWLGTDQGAYCFRGNGGV